MVESGGTEGGKNTASFHFRAWTQQESTSQQHKQEASRFKVISSGGDIGSLYTRT